MEALRRSAPATTLTDDLICARFNRRGVPVVHESAIQAIRKQLSREASPMEALEGIITQALAHLERREYTMQVVVLLTCVV